MKPHYFDQSEPDADDFQSAMARGQGYVPVGCLLGGASIMALASDGKQPCKGCACPREKCKGRPE